MNRDCEIHGFIVKVLTKDDSNNVTDSRKASIYASLHWEEPVRVNTLTCDWIKTLSVIIIHSLSRTACMQQGDIIAVSLAVKEYSP